MNQNTPSYQFLRTLYRMPPNAVAVISGNQENPQLRGIVRFYQTAYQGILIEAEISGLPYETDRTSSSTVSASQNSSASPTSSASPDLPASMASPFSFYAMHIHQFGNCTLPFDKTGEHYNPDQLPHPEHAGDLLPLLGNHGYAWSAFYDGRLSIDEIIGKSLIIHRNPDDFRTQPSGNSGVKIGCGVIQRVGM